MAVVCEAVGCEEPLPPGRKRFHSDQCSERQRKREQRAAARAVKFEVLAAENRAASNRPVKAANRARVSAAESKDGRASARRGDGYQDFVQRGWPQRLDRGEASVAEAAELFGTSHANVSRWMAAWGEDQRLAAERSSWRMADAVAALLVPSPAAFAEFRRQTFVDEWGAPYQTPAFQLVWIESVLKAIESGGRLVILSPPRHGKTQLLIHFCVWLILVRPNVRIMWIGGNEDIAKQSTGAVMDILENTPELAERFLGPGGSFKPLSRSGKSWAADKFTVATRQGAGIKSPTMIAVGKGGKLLSRDADLIVADDIVDADSVKSPAQREHDAKWFNTAVSSRKESHTALMGIGSRQHHEDLWGSLVQNRAFTAIVEHAHDPACEIPAHKPEPVSDEHPADCAECALHDGCLLWPGKRTFSFLQDQRVAMDDDRMYEMVYLNVTRPDGEEYLTEEAVRACRNDARGLGLAGLPQDARLRLIAGLDPAVAGFQVAFLWAVDVASNKRYMVDLFVHRAGGLPGARRIIREWFVAYGVASWVIERNGYQEALLQDRDILDYCSSNGIHLEPHYTHAYNKYDPYFGLTKQFDLYRDQLVDLPWRDETAREKVRQLEKQLLQFEGPKTKTPTDILMAAWFPETVIRRWRTEERSTVEVDYAQTQYEVDLLGDMYEQVA